MKESVTVKISESVTETEESATVRNKEIEDAYYPRFDQTIQSNKILRAAGNNQAITGKGARTAEECGLTNSKMFVNKTTVAGADGSIVTVNLYYDANCGNVLGERYENVQSTQRLF